MKDLRPARALKRRRLLFGKFVHVKLLAAASKAKRNGPLHLECGFVIDGWSKVTLVSTGHRTLRGNGMPFPSTPTQNSYRFPGNAMEARNGFVI
jgi:hypothetical protein